MTHSEVEAIGKSWYVVGNAWAWVIDFRMVTA
jgi:hypothetical protein